MISVIEHKPGLSVRANNDMDRQAYITIVDADLQAVLAGTAPVSNVSINQGVDMDAHKAFDGNYTIASFGKSLTSIVIRGLDIYANLTAGGMSCPYLGWNDIQGWWRENSFDKVPNKRIRISVYSRNGAATFQCVAVSLSRSIDANAGDNNATAGTYILSCYGVEEK